VQGEHNENTFLLLSRRLSSAKIVQGEHNENTFLLLSRCLSSAKIIKNKQLFTKTRKYFVGLQKSTTFAPTKNALAG